VHQAVGALAETTAVEGSTLSALLVSKDAQYTLLLPSDLHEFTGLSTSTITQRQRLALSVGWELVKWHLGGMYGKIQEGVDDEGRPTIRVRPPPLFMYPIVVSDN
jgi:cleavage and polyadenylation specificity factor subunit 3